MSRKSIEERLLELLSDADMMPLYTAYRWWAKESVGKGPIGAFLDFIEPLVDSERLRLLQVPESGAEAIEHFEIPASLVADYERSGHNDDLYDPFGYVLSLGPAAAHLAEKPWRIAIDFEKGTFVVTSRASLLEEVLSSLRSEYPDTRFDVLERDQEGDTVRLSGRINREN